MAIIKQTYDVRDQMRFVICGLDFRCEKKCTLQVKHNELVNLVEDKKKTFSYYSFYIFLTRQSWYMILGGQHFLFTSLLLSQITQ